MNTHILLSSVAIVASVVVVTTQSPSTQVAPSSPVRATATRTAGPQAAASMTAAAQNQAVAQYCASCHSEAGKAGGVSLAAFDANRAADHADVVERMIKKLRAGMMPPPGARRPDAAILDGLVSFLEARVDRAAAQRPNPGRRPFQRLNRVEYQRSVQSLLDLDVDVTAFLPPDTVSGGFDNVADVQSFSPALMEGYLRAASQISRIAIGDRAARPGETTFVVPKTASQVPHVEGTPWGTRGGIAVTHVFPADGEYTFRLMMQVDGGGGLYGETLKAKLGKQFEQIELSINGERVAAFEINPKMSETDKNGMNFTTPRIHVKAGPQQLAAAFLQLTDGVFDDVMKPIDYTMADTIMGNGYGITTLPHLRNLSVTGPFTVTGVSETPSRRKIFVCRPTAPGEEEACARRIVSRLATEAYRRPVDDESIESLMGFYRTRRKDTDFEGGVRGAVQAILASPEFVFRLEEAPQTVAAGSNFRISTFDLASRLAFFLWAAPPDEELLRAATAGALRTPGGLDRQVRRMLADPKAETLSTRFASQWFRLQDLDQIRPDALLYPSYDNRLAAAYRRETELFFDTIVRENRSVLDLINADYTFVNERSARAYGIPGISGDQYQRVTLGSDTRRGVLGHGSVLMLTSIADRTSPVNRGKWIMEVLLGTPPPPPPPDVPAFEDTKAVSEVGKLLTVRQRMEEHRRNATCASCHRVMDPLGLALENFDVTGVWRINDSGAPVDPTGELYDGSKVNGPASVRAALNAHAESVLRNFTENLMAYALGRRVEYFDQPTVRAIVKRASTESNRFSAFVLGVVNSPAFQMSRSEELVAAADPQPQEPDNAARR